ncbi:MAG: hypothetical protein GY828_05875 [Candidatus Gracilibacteria bacterium]|nr:hypothetical protein [Candidatus Gracilibacteria bacterium]
MEKTDKSFMEVKLDIDLNFDLKKTYTSANSPVTSNFNIVDIIQNNDMTNTLNFLIYDFMNNWENTFEYDSFVSIKESKNLIL